MLSTVLQDLYLSSSGGFELNPDSGHFTLRHNPRVQPLTTGVSYAAATPPPPALHSPRQGELQDNTCWAGTSYNVCMSSVSSELAMCQPSA